VVDAEHVGSPPRNDAHAARTLERADQAADAALSELPDALIMAFDTKMRFILTSGQPIARLGSPRAFRSGEPVAAAFPTELWEAIG
jgi:hypothetical protein